MDASVAQIRAGLASPDGPERLQAARQLEAWLAARLEAGGSDWTPVVDALLPHMVAGLGDAEKGVQVHCAECLQFLAYQSEAVIPALRAALTPPGQRRAWGAAFVLARLGLWSEEVGEALASAMGAPDRDIRWAAAGFALALGRSHPECVQMVKRALHAPEPRARKMAAYCLGAMGEYADVAEALAGRLADPDRDVRRAAILALNRLPRVDAGVQQAVARLRHDPDKFVRRAADAVVSRWSRAYRPPDPQTTG